MLKPKKKISALEAILLIVGFLLVVSFGSGYYKARESGLKPAEAALQALKQITSFSILTNKKTS